MMAHVTPEMVLIEAARMDPGERWRAWLECGGDAHPIQTLPPSAGGGTKTHYCVHCWTVFSDWGPVNPPDRMRDTSRRDSDESFGY